MNGKTIIILGVILAVALGVALAAALFAGLQDDTAPHLVEPQHDPVPVEPRPAGVHPDATQGKITKIIDGDTLHFDAVRYRLSLIDTPERGEDGFWEATNALKELCPKGSIAYMDEDSIRQFDKYGRHLGTVWCEGNNYSTTAGAWLHANGLLEKFYAEFCSSTEAATSEWAEVTGTWTYYEACK